jgi:hypothetical protein
MLVAFEKEPDISARFFSGPPSSGMRMNHPLTIEISRLASVLSMEKDAE